ncbi:MAG: response regulator transcription factor [Lachnospiraceae bacterium]
MGHLPTRICSGSAPGYPSEQSPCTIFWRDGHRQAQTDENRLEQLRLTFGLTPRETQILQLLLTFSSNEEITDSLGISAHTLQKHMQNIFRKTGVSSRWELLKKGQTL